MKYLFNIIVVLITSFTLFSCNKEERQMKSVKNDLEIVVQAERYVVADPWMVTVTLTINDKEGSTVSTQREVVASDITEKDVEFNWVNDNTCNVKINQMNGVPAIIPVKVER